MRNIEFRGFHPDENGSGKVLVNEEWTSGEWIHGDLIHRRIWSSDLVVIRVFDSGFDNYEEYEVIPETVGEYTNSNDLNSKRVFEGDIVKCKHYIYTAYSIDSADGGDLEVGYEYKDTLSGNGAVIYRDGCFTIDDEDFDFVLGLGIFEKDEIEVVGNMYENPELLTQ